MFALTAIYHTTIKNLPFYYKDTGVTFLPGLRYRYHAGFPGGPEDYKQYMPSLFRVQRSTRVRLANIIDAGRVSTPQHPSLFVAAGNGTDPRTWNAILQQDGPGFCGAPPDHDAGKGGSGVQCTTTRVLDRPVVWEWRE